MKCQNIKIEFICMLDYNRQQPKRKKKKNFEFAFPVAQFENENEK